MLAKAGLGPDSSINLVRQDGIRIVRFPYDVRDVGMDISAMPTFRRAVQERNGRFTERSGRDGVHRLFTFTQVGDLPLILAIGLSTEEIEAGWRAKALMIGLTLLALFWLAVWLALLCARELRRREAVEAELARLSMTDGLTGLPNRRRFDEVLQQAIKAAARSHRPLALLIVDADHFKRFNDRYGHAVGDEILRGLAHCLSAGLRRPCDLVCRIGGEEFGVILPGTDEAGAMHVAERLHAEIATMSVASVGLPAGTVTVSIGLAHAVGGGRPSSTGRPMRRSTRRRARAATAPAGPRRARRSPTCGWWGRGRGQRTVNRMRAAKVPNSPANSQSIPRISRGRAWSAPVTRAAPSTIRIPSGRDRPMKMRPRTAS